MELLPDILSSTVAPFSGGRYKPVVKKRPITPMTAKLLLSLYTLKGLENMDLMELRSVAFFLVLYFCCVRQSRVSLPGSKEQPVPGG